MTTMTLNLRPERYRNDTWCLGDGYGPELLGDHVARLALEAQTPFTLGVVGKWGSGKTSILRRAFATLGGRPIAQAVPIGEPREEALGGEWARWHHRTRTGQPALGWDDALHAVADVSLCVWFSPWQHQHADNPLIPLLLEVRAQFEVWQRLKDEGKRLDRQGGQAALALLERVTDAAASLTLGRPVRLAEGASEAVRKAWREGTPKLELSDGQRFHLAFEDAVDMLFRNEQSDARLIVFVDDLDRCEEAVIVELLEAVKLYLSSRRCLFVLGVDDGAVLDALKRRWTGRPDDANREYLEKLFQATLPVPLPGTRAVRAAVAQQFKEHRLPGHDALGVMVEALIEPSPRKLKNFVNSACALWGLVREHPHTNTPEFARLFILFQYLRTQHRPVWRVLERQPWALRVLEQVLTSGARLDAGSIPSAFGTDDQRLSQELFFRSFAHVLREPQGDGATDELRKRHGHLPIAEAVELMLQRADRKRSDEQFVQHFKELVVNARLESVPDALLRLPEPA